MKNRIKLLVLPLVLWVVATAHGQFVTTWQTDLGGSSCGSCLEITTSPLYSYSYDVDWDNDGVYDDIGVTGDISNTYPTAGQVTIAIRGTFPAFAGGLDASKLISVDDWGGLAWQDLSFANCDNLVSTPTSVAPDLSAVTSLASCFASCNSFNSAIGHWDVSNIADFSYMFNGAPSFDQDLSSWNLASAFTLQAMFLNASSFNQDLSAWDVSNIEFLGAMFVEASSFDQSLGAWTFAPNVNFRLFGATGFLEDSGMSCENFSTTLIGWARNPAMPDNRDFGSVFPLEYGEGAATAAFNYLTFQKGWNFANAFEGSCSNNCESPFPLSIQTVMPSSDGSVQVELVDGSPPYEGSIDGSQIGQYNTDQFTITGLAPGPHTLLVVDGAFCADEATFTIPEVSTSLVISEIMYNPPELGEDSLEYLNITNAGNTPIDLQGASVAAIDFTFGNVSIAPSEVITICKDSVALRQTFIIPTSQRLYQYIGSLANMGETIILQDTGGDILDSLTYRTTMPWPSNGAGDGYAIALCALVADNADGANWQRSTRDVCQDINNLALHGSPLLLSACDTCYDVCRIPVALPVGGPCEVNGQMGTLDGFCRCILDNTAALEITLWHDANGDGQQEIGAGDECGEDPLDMDEAIFQLLDGGVPATDVNGNPVIFVNVGGGVYRAENLAPGSNYTVLATPDAAVSWQITQAHFDGSVADVGDSDVDSDFDPLTGLSPVFEIVPGNTKVNIDLGMWQSLTLGGTVFLSYDCIQCTYSGPPNQYFATDVLVNLWGENPVGSGIFTLNLGQVQTSIGGIYEFTNLSPGDYRIEVDHTAFQSGGQFEVFMPLPLCDLPNNDLSHQNDGEGSFNASGGLDINFARLRSGCEPAGGGTENRTFDFGVCNEFDCTLSGQQFTEPQCTAVDPTDPNHNPIFPICDLFILDNFCSTMTTGNSPGNQPSPLCANGGVPHNTSWFSFVAGEGDYQIEITPGNCQNVGGAIGFASGIYTDCSFSQEVQCEGACTTAPITFTSQDPPGSGNYLLEPCEVYYWFLDGCNGSVCDYEVQILGNFSSCDPHAPTDLVCTGNLGLGSDCLNSLCTGESVVLELEDVELEGMTYNWSVMPDDGQWTINNSDPDANVTTQTIDPFLDITFDPALGPSSSLTYTVCWENLQSKCIFKAGPICRDIVIADLDEDFGTVTVCESDLFAYPGPEFDENGNSDPNGDGESGWQCVMGFVPGVNTCDAVTPGGCQYTQTVFVVEALNSAPERFDTVVCDEWSLHGIDFPAENYIERPFFLSPDILNVNGCDTFIDLYAWYMHMDGLITLDCASGGQPPYALTLDTFNVSDASPDTTTLITVDWYRPDFGIGEGFELLDGDPDANPFTFSTNRSGEWVAIVTMTVVIEAGSDTLPGCEFVFSIDVDPSTFVIPGDPVPGPWDLMPDTTNGQPVQYTITSGTGDTPMWLWPSDVTSATGQGTDTLTIDWTGSSGGELAVFASNGCGVSDTISAEVTPFGQDCDRLFIELDLLYDVDSTNVCVDVNVNCFDSMELVQFSLRWDPNVINYQPPYIIEFGGDTTLITASAIAINESNADNGVLITQWLSPSIDLEGLSLEDGSTILRFCFSIIGDPCTSTRIRMSDNPTNIEFIQTNGISWTSEDINASSDLIQVEPGDLAVLASNCSTSPGNDDGNIRFSACGAGGPYTWLINGVPGTDPDSILSGEEVLISDLANGEYTIVVTDANGDTASTIVQIETGSSGVTFDLNGIDPNCFYRENGQIELSNVSSTLDIIETAWSTGDFNTNRVRGLGPGIYTVSLTDEVGCVTVRSDTLMVDTIMATFTIVDSADCAGELGLVTAQASGGIPLNGDLYFFNGVFPMSNYSESFPAGPFEIIVSDDVGCEITLTGEMPISSRDVSLGTIGIMPSDTVVCINAPAFDLTWSLTGGLQDSSGVASWSGTGIIDASLGTFDPAVSGVGEFSIMLEYAEGPDGVCSYLASSTVTVIVDASCVTDVDDVDEQAAAIIIYPNPATDLIHIEGLSQQHSIVVYDIYGRPMPLPANGDSLDLTNLPRGLYILSVHDQDGLTHAVRRFVKQ